jgi:hypothetical protein
MQKEGSARLLAYLSRKNCPARHLKEKEDDKNKEKERGSGGQFS